MTLSGPKNQSILLRIAIGTEQISQIDSLHAPVKLVGDQTLNNIILSRVIVIQ